jgi:hypothetical protein
MLRTLVDYAAFVNYIGNMIIISKIADTAWYDVELPFCLGEGS